MSELYPSTLPGDNSPRGRNSGDGKKGESLVRRFREAVKGRSEAKDKSSVHCFLEMVKGQEIPLAPEEAIEELRQFSENLIGSYDEMRFSRGIEGERWENEEEIRQLKEGAAKEVKRLLEEVLPPLWEEICRKFPECRGFPATELWRLALSGRAQGPTLESIPFSGDPGFLVGTLRIQALVFAALLMEQKLTEPLYRLMWGTATSKLAVKVGVRKEKKFFGGDFSSLSCYRDRDACIISDKGRGHSRAGIKAYHKKHNNLKWEEKDETLRILKRFGSYGEGFKDKQHYNLEPIKQYECKETAERNIKRFYEYVEAIKKPKNDETIDEEKKDAILDCIIEENQEFAQNHLFEDGTGRLHTFGVFLFWSIENGFSPTILWSSFFFGGMHPEEIKWDVRFGWETVTAYCNGEDPETCHDTPERMEQVARFDHLSAEERRFWRYATDGWLDNSVFIELAKDDKFIQLESKTDRPSGLLERITRLFADLPYHREDPKAAMIDLSDLRCIAEDPSSNPEMKAYQEKICTYFQELKLEYEEYRRAEAESFSKISIDEDLRKKCAAEDAMPEMKEIIEKFDRMKQNYCAIRSYMSEKVNKAILESLVYAPSHVWNIFRKGITKSKSNLKLFHELSQRLDLMKDIVDKLEPIKQIYNQMENTMQEKYREDLTFAKRRASKVLIKGKYGERDKLLNYFHDLHKKFQSLEAKKS